MKPTYLAGRSICQLPVRGNDAISSSSWLRECCTARLALPRATPNGAYVRHTRKPEDVAAYIDEGNRLTGHIEVEGAQGAQVIVDGEVQLGVVPLAEPIDVVPGAHEVELRARGKKFMVPTKLVAGETRRLTFDMEGGEPAPLLPHPTEEEVLLRAAARGTTTSTSPSESSLHGEKASAFPTLYVVGGALVTVGLGAVIAGAVFGANSSSQADEATSLRAQNDPEGVSCRTPSAADAERCRSLNEKVDAYDGKATLSTIFFVGGTVLTVGGLALLGGTYLHSRSSNSRPSALHISPSVGRTHVGAALDMRF